MIVVELDTSGFDRWVNLLLTQALDDLEAIIFNLVPYVIYLEFGSSQQAPNGMVRVSVQEIAMRLRNRVANIPFDKAAHTGRLREELIAALNDTGTFGQLLIRSRTPIKTGRARRGWGVIKADDPSPEAIIAAARAQDVEARAQPGIAARLRGGA